MPGEISYAPQNFFATDELGAIGASPLKNLSHIELLRATSLVSGGQAKLTPVGRTESPAGVIRSRPMLSLTPSGVLCKTGPGKAS
jgi:hypothetical protein